MFWERKKIIMKDKRSPPKRYQTTMAVKPMELPDFESLLQLLYRGTKNPQLPDHAIEFLKELRDKGSEGRFTRSNWEEYCKKHDITKTTYYTMINKLVGCGLIETVDRDFYRLSNRAEHFFSSIANSIKAFMAKKHAAPSVE